MLHRHARASMNVLFATVVVAVMMAVAATPAAATTFTDTSSGAVTEAAAALAAEGVVNGCREGEFCPDDQLTRAQLASVLVAALDLPEAESTPFTDVGDGVHASSIASLAAAGITQGCAADLYCPQDTITRAQLASMLATAFEVAPTDERFFDDVGATHGAAVDRLAAAGIAAGCGTPLTAFCAGDPVIRAHAALFLARAMDLVDRVEITSFADRQAQQAEIDEAARLRREADAEAAAARRAEEEASAAAAAAAARDKIWNDLARCESGGNWAINTGNGYYGGLQFSLSSWRWVGGSGYPHQATRTEQVRRGEILLSRQGWRAWPTCTLRLGYR